MIADSPATRMFSPPTLNELLRDLARERSGEVTQVDRRRRRHQRRTRGVYFTPWPLVRFVTAHALRARVEDPALEWRADGSPCLRVLDPCAGDGRFSLAAAEYLAGAASRRGHDRARAHAAIVERCVLAIERDPELADIARQRLGDRAVVHCCDALLDPPGDVRAVDVILGNPPYVRSIRMRERERAALCGRYEATSYGEWDVYAAFIEQTWDWLAPGGHAGLVVPSRWFTAAFATGLRRRLGHERGVRGLVDFGAMQVFDDATTYTSLVFLSRAENRRVAVARYAGGSWQCGRIEASELSAQPWLLSTGETRALIQALAGGGPALGHIARIAKGAGTNADGVYVLERARRVGERVRGTPRTTGREIEVEADATRPCVRGRDVRAYGAVGTDVQCLVPYERDGTPWSPERLSAHPLAAAHLEACRPLLEARERGRFAGARYYRFGRPQNLAFLGARAPKLVVPDVALSGRALIDHTGAMVLDSAYAIRLLPDARPGYSLELILAVLNSPILRFWLTHTGIFLRGGYVRMKTAYLSSLPLPPISEHARRVHQLVSSAPGRVDEGAVARELCRAYGLGAQLGVWADGNRPASEPLSV